MLLALTALCSRLWLCILATRSVQLLRLVPFRLATTNRTAAPFGSRPATLTATVSCRAVPCRWPTRWCLLSRNQ